MIFHPFSKNPISHYLASCAFLLLFPGFFFYHFAIARGYIPPLGGYFGVVAVLCFPPLALVYLKNHQLKLNRTLSLFILINAHILFILICNYILDKPHGYSTDMAVWSVSGILFNLVVFLIGSQVNFPRLLNANFFALILMFIVVVLNVGEHGIFYVKLEAVDESVVASYQGFARSLVFVSLILTAAFIDNSKKFALVFIISFIALFLNGSRTDFALYIASSLIMYLLHMPKSPKDMLLLIGGIVALFFLSINLADTYPESRILQLFLLQESTSFQGRSELNEYGWSLVSDSPLIGNYGMYINLGGIGNYPHNLLSAWVNLGIIGFLLYIILLFLLLKSALFRYEVNSTNLTFRIYFIFTLFAVASIILSRDYNDMSIGFSVGLLCNWKKSKDI